MDGKLVFEDGEEYKFPDVSYNHFLGCGEFYMSGHSDIEYANYLRDNGMKDITDFMELENTFIVIKDEENSRIVKYKFYSDSFDDEVNK